MGERVEERPVETTLYSLTDAPPEPGRQHEDERQLSLFRVGSITIDDRRELCLIKNISAGGMRIRAYCAIEEGKRLSVELKSGEPVSGSVRWISGDNVGIGFDTPVDVLELLTLSMEGPRPRMPRVEVDCFASARQGAEVYRVQARDISQGGVKLASGAELKIRGELVVSLPGLDPLPGVVRWRDDGCYGITFNKILPLPVLVAWIHARRERLRVVR
ncbi:MAG TPA: PilZ domain-containing protein [Sphingomicrobium sp.]|nr:PilZ domain-containing protein [Sphingomicrobium sp.]